MSIQIKEGGGVVFILILCLAIFSPMQAVCVGHSGLNPPQAEQSLCPGQQGARWCPRGASQGVRFGRRGLRRRDEAGPGEEEGGGGGEGGGVREDPYGRLCGPLPELGASVEQPSYHLRIGEGGSWDALVPLHARLSQAAACAGVFGEGGMGCGFFFSCRVIPFDY